MTALNSPVTLELSSPLFTDWAEQYVRLSVPGLPVGVAADLTIDGAPADFQYTGGTGGSADGAEVLLRLGFSTGQTRRLVCRTAA